MSGEGVRELTNPKLAGEGFLSRRPSHVFADRWPPSVASWVSDGTGRRSTSCVIVKDSLTTVSTRTGGLLTMLYTTVLCVKPMSTMLGSQKPDGYRNTAGSADSKNIYRRFILDYRTLLSNGSLRTVFVQQ